MGQLGHENRMFDFETKIKNPRPIPIEDLFFDLHPRISDTFILSAPSKIF